MYGKKSMGIIRSTFVIDKDGKSPKSTPASRSTIRQIPFSASGRALPT